MTKRNPSDRTADTGGAAWTRAQFLRRFAGGGAGLLVLGAGGAAAGELLGTAGAFARSAGAARPAVWDFHSRPTLHPPAVTIRHAASEVADGYLFLSPNSGPGQPGPLILDNAGDVVWFHPTAPRAAMNFRAALYKGAPVLTWWEGVSRKGFGVGEHVIFDASYRELLRFPAGDHRQADLHELLLTPRGTALVTSYERRPADLSVVGGRKKGVVVGGVVQELEIPSARVLFEWRSLEHVALEESRRPVLSPWDYFHVNSIDVDPDGDLLVSARNTWAVYKISRETGRVIWRLGGKKSDFAMGRGTVFAWQHDARHHGNGRRITIFDDGAAPKVEPQSRALVIELDTRRMRATLVREYTHRPRLLARAMGNVQQLPNGNLLVGWGTEPYITEFAEGGAVRHEVQLPHGGENYRAFRFPWVGRPSRPPTLVAHPGVGAAALFASWNGATEVASWRLLTGKAAGRLQPSLTVPRRGFETALTPPAGTAYAAAVALDARGKPLGRSATVRL